MSSIQSNRSINSILKEKFEMQKINDEVVVVTEEEALDEIKKINIIINDGFTSMIQKTDEDKLLEILALLKEFGGYLGAALVLSITTYCLTTEGTIQDLIIELPNMVNNIVKSAIPEAIQLGNVAIQHTTSSLFSRALLGYISGNPNSFFGDIKILQNTAIGVVKQVNDKILDLPKNDNTMRNAILENKAGFNITKKIKDIFKFPLVEKINQIIQVPSLIWKRDGNKIIARLYNFYSNVREVVGNVFRSDDSSFSIGSEKTPSKDSIEDSMNSIVVSLTNKLESKSQEVSSKKNNDEEINIQGITGNMILISENITITNTSPNTSPKKIKLDETVAPESVTELKQILSEAIDTIVNHPDTIVNHPVKDNDDDDDNKDNGTVVSSLTLTNSFDGDSFDESNDNRGGSKRKSKTSKKSSKRTKHAKKTTKHAKKNTKRAKKSNKHTKKH